MSSSDSLQDNEPPAKKQRVDSDGDQDVVMATGTEHDSNMTSLGQSEVEKTVASPGTYNFTIANGQLISTDNSQNGSSLLPKVTQVQLTNPCVQQIRPGQISLAAGGMGIRPGVTMASMIRPALQFQTIASGGQQKVISATPGQIRVPMQASQAQMVMPGQGSQGQVRPNVQFGGLQIPVQQRWTVDGKMTFQISNNAVRAVHPRAVTTLTQGVVMTTMSQRQTSIPTIAVHKSGQISMLQKPTMTKVSSAGDMNLLKLQPSAQTSVEQPKVGSPQPQQISFQVPLNWSGTGSNKSLLESGKVSVLSSAQTGTQSIIKPSQSASSLLEPASASVTEPSQITPIRNQPVVSSMTSVSSTASTNAPAGIAVSQIQKPITSVTVANIPKITAAKGGSFVFSAGNKVAFVPSSQVVTQIVKTDSKSVGKVTMAEAQIMLPSGPAKISWPVPPQTKDGKHIFLTKQALQPGSPPCKGKTTDINAALKSGTVSASLIASTKIVTDGGSKLVTDGGPHSKFLLQGNSATKTVPQKNMILQTQRSWELVRQQASLLMPKKNIPGSNQNTKAQTVEKANEDDNTVADTGDKMEEKGKDQSDNKEKEKTDSMVTEDQVECKTENESITEHNGVGTKQKSENTDDTQNVAPDSQSQATVDADKLDNDGQDIVEDNNNEPPKTVDPNISSKESDSKCKIEVSDTSDKDTVTCVTEQSSVHSESSEKLAEGEDNTYMKKVEDTEVTPEPMETDATNSETYKCMANEEKKEASEDNGDFDAVGAMDWKDGVGELPGSDLKFRMNDLGVLEVITDDLLCNETLNTSSESEKTTKETEDTTIKIEPKTEPIKEEPSEDAPAVSNKDKISQCENCGEYGFVTDFYKEGRFCSQTCIGAFDSKRMREVKRHGAMSRVVLGLKNKRKKMLFKDSINGNGEIKKEGGLQGGKKPKAFIWSKYLEDEKAIDTPPKLFKNPFPSARNNFRVGMRLEGVDPSHQSLFCVLSVSELCGHRIRLHFDGYSECYDFWTDIDSPYIFPVTFCEKNGKTLQPPKGFMVDDFSWSAYLKMTRGSAAPKSLFTNQPVQSVTPNAFRIGSKLEAVDKKNSSLICVATVADTMGDKILVHFDGWDNNYDYWCDVTSPFIHPIGFCDANGYVLSPPCNYNAGDFSWDTYLNETKSSAVPARAFKPKAPVAFDPGMKIELVDKRNPVLVRVATIVEIENHMVRVHFDGWLDSYDYWLDDDSPDLHPPGWCAKTGHPLVPPISASDLVVSSGPGVCPTPGCKGIGHIKGPKFNGHHSPFGCPYSEINMNKESVLGDRLGGSTREETGAPPTVIRPPEQAAELSMSRRCPTDGCDGTGHVTGKFPYHSKPSGCPKLHQQKEKKDPRGRKPKSYYLNLAEQEARQARETEEKEHLFRQGVHNSVFMSSMITTPRNEQPLCWDQHSKLLPGVSGVAGNDVTKWSIEDVAAFVKSLPGCDEHAKTFIDEQIDGEAFLLLTQSDIVKILNIKLGPALKIFNSIIMFKNSMEV